MRNTRNCLFMFLIVGISIATKSFSQSLPDSTIRKIDNLFQKWNNTSSPGCAIGIVRNDSLIFSKGYGMANLEYEIPLTPETIFYMASVSKQFTGYSIILLARQGKLKLDDDIHVYLQWMPDLGKKITIRNLLNHTSGIRDGLSLAAISGVGADGMITQDLALNILKRQRSLNFNPGDKYAYSNSNYILLAQIVENVSGKSFRTFVDSAIFKPLGMAHSHFEDNYYELIKNRAESYSATGNGHYENSFKNIFTMGDGGSFTNVNDMAKWIINFYEPHAGDSKDIEQLTLRGKLNNGKELLYASGIMVDHYKGWRFFTHSGSLSGYCTNIAVYPDLKMGFIVFGNEGDFFSTYSKINQLADLFIKDTSSNLISKKKLIKDSTNSVTDNTVNLKKFSGDYVSDDGIHLNFRISNDRLYTNVYGQSFILSKEKMDTFSFFAEPDLKFSFSNNTANDSFVLATFFTDEIHLFKKYVGEISQGDELLRTYTGVYYCPELDCKYGIILKNHHLILTSNKYNDAQLTLIDANHLLNDFGEMNLLLVTRDKINQITGFEVNNNAVRHLKFNKIE